MDLNQKSDHCLWKAVTYFVAVILLFSGFSHTSHAALEDDDSGIRPEIVDDDSFIEPPPEDDEDNPAMRAQLPFGGRRDSARPSFGRNSGNNNGGNSRFSQSAKGSSKGASGSSNDRFGKTEGKVQFKMVDNELIKKTVEEKKLDGIDISKAPLLPHSTTTKEDLKKQKEEMDRQ